MNTLFGDFLTEATNRSETDHIIDSDSMRDAANSRMKTRAHAEDSTSNVKVQDSHEAALQALQHIASRKEKVKLLDKLFETMIKWIHETPSTTETDATTSISDKLRLYGLYKHIRNGPARVEDETKSNPDEQKDQDTRIETTSLWSSLEDLLSSLANMNFSSLHLALVPTSVKEQAKLQSYQSCRTLSKQEAQKQYIEILLRQPTAFGQKCRGYVCEMAARIQEFQSGGYDDG